MAIRWICLFMQLSVSARQEKKRDRVKIVQNKTKKGEET